MTDHSSSIYVSGEEVEVFDPSTVSRGDLLSSQELLEFIETDPDPAAEDAPATFTTEHGSFYAVGSDNPSGELTLSGVVPAAEAREEIDLET